MPELQLQQHGSRETSQLSLKIIFKIVEGLRYGSIIETIKNIMLRLKYLLNI